MLPLKEGTGAVLPRAGMPTKHHDVGALPYRGEYGDRTGLRQASQRPSPFSGPSFQFPHLGTGFVKSRRGVEKPKGTEQLEIDAMGRSSRRAMQGHIVSIFATVTRPKGDCKMPEGGFHLRFLQSRT